MRTPRKRTYALAVLLAALIAAGALVPLAWQDRQAQPLPATVTTSDPAAAPSGAPAPAVSPDNQAAAPAAGTEEVPAEEAETDRSNNAVGPSGPTLSFGRAAGLHLAPDPLKLSSSAALVVDRTTGEVLVRKNDQAILPMASLTKLMTTLLVVEAKQPMDEVLTITDDDVDRERHSRSRLRVGTRLTREEALRLALMSSENRATHALGRAYPGGLPKLLEAMNARARKLGMANTTYVDPTGLSNGNRSTARDLALLVGEASKVPLLREFSVEEDHVATLGGRTLQYRNSNRLVRNDAAGWDIELQKTGYIVEAGRCLTMLTKVAGHELVMVMLDADSNGARLADAQKLRRWVVAQNGWHDTLAAERPRAAPRQRVIASRKKPEASAKGKTAIARAEPKTGAKKRSARTAVAKKEPSPKEGRVRHTFASDKDEPKS
ncbi:serine hydrolase [Ramlibacter sp. PS3R-8]|uniref:D-alanyl-D-alanine carboxypeptidase family protein n=1 Tax=Ramlibacter sp. PS3R-8 TaxID=3133437 RepID=UPI0030AEE49F